MTTSSRRAFGSVPVACAAPGVAGTGPQTAARWPVSAQAAGSPGSMPASMPARTRDRSSVRQVSSAPDITGGPEGQDLISHVRPSSAA